MYHVRGMNVCTTLYGNWSKSCWDVLLTFTIVTLMLGLEEKARGLQNYLDSSSGNQWNVNECQSIQQLLRYFKLDQSIGQTTQNCEKPQLGWDDRWQTKAMRWNYCETPKWITIAWMCTWSISERPSITLHVSWVHLWIYDISRPKAGPLPLENMCCWVVSHMSRSRHTLYS